MKHKLLFIFFVILFSINFVFALNFDNVKTYDSINKEVTITNAFGLGSEIAKMQLKSNLIEYVVPGSNKKVAEIELVNFDNSYLNAFEKIELLDLRKMQVINRPVTYKYAKINYIDVPNYVKVCEKQEIYSKENGTQTVDICTTKQEGTIKRETIEWIPFKELNELPDKNIRIGIFTTVYKNDYVEWIPTFFGVKINEWAIWSATWNSGLVSYWSMEQLTGDEPDRVNGDNNITQINATRGVSGIIGNGLYFHNWSTGQGEYANMSQNIKNYNSSTGAISIWFNWTPQIDQDDRLIYIISFDPSVTSESNSIILFLDNRSGTDNIIGAKLYYSTVFFNCLNINSLKNQWTHLVLNKNVTDAELYINGTLKCFATNRNWFNDSLNTVGGVNMWNIADKKGVDTVGLRGTIDEIGIWNRTLNADEILGIYQAGLSGNGYVKEGMVISLSPQSGITTLNSTLNASISPINITLTNATLFLYYSSNGSLINSTTNVLTGVSENITKWVMKDMPLIYPLKWNVYACGNKDDSSALCEFKSSNYTINYGYQLNSETHSSEVSSSSNQNFVLNTNLTVTDIVSSSAYITYNYTIYTATKTTSGNQTIFTAAATTPNILGSPVTINYNWTLNLVNSNGVTYSSNVSSQSQSVNAVGIDNCTIYNDTILNFTLWDEDDRTQLNGTIDLLVKLYTTNTTSVVKTFNMTFNYNPIYANAKICRSLINDTYDMSYEAKYWSNTSFYDVEYKYADKIAHNNNTGIQNIKLYDLLISRTTNCIFQVQDELLKDIEGAIIDVQRQYIPLNSFISVESPKTDYSGQTNAHLVLNDVLYNFPIYLNGELIGTFNNYRVTSSTCNFAFNLIQSSAGIQDYSSYGDVSVIYTLDKIGRTLTANWITVDSVSHEITWRVLKNDQWGNTTICENSAEGTTGAFVCTIPQTYGNSSIVAEIWSSSTLTFIGRTIFTLEDTGDKIFGGLRIIFGLLMYSSLVLLMIAEPTMIVIGAILGIIFAFFFSLIDGGTTGGGIGLVIFFIIGGAIIIFRLAKTS